MNSFFVTGTDTAVGKTYIASMLIRQLRERGHDVVGMKPVASGMIVHNGQKINEDIEALTAASGLPVDGQRRQDVSDLVNQYCYEPFLSPHIAASRLGEKIELSVIRHACSRLDAITDAVIIEGVGGLMTPLSDHETCLDLAVKLELPMILVVAVRLGCISHSLLTQSALGGAGLRLAGWIANYPLQDSIRDEAVEASLCSMLDAPCLGVVSWGNAQQQLAVDLLIQV